MKHLAYIFVALSILIWACKNENDTLQPKFITKINLDQLGDSVETVNVAAEVIYFNDWFISNQELKDQFIPTIINLTQGPDSTFYVFDFRNSRVVQFSENGKFLRAIGGPGSGPGEFMHPIGTIFQSNNHIYIPDTQGMRIQIFNSHFSLIRTITNAYIDGGNMWIGGNSNLFSTSSREPEINEKYMIFVSDSLGKIINKIGHIKDDDSFVFENGIKKPYFIVASNQCIWCISEYSPEIRRYDYNGCFLEQIQFVSDEINSLLEQGESRLKKKRIELKNLKIIGGTMMIENPQLLKNGEVVVNIGKHGNIQLSIKNGQTKISKRYIFFGQSPLIKKGGPQYCLSIINDRIYAHHRKGVIIKSN